MVFQQVQKHTGDNEFSRALDFSHPPSTPSLILALPSGPLVLAQYPGPWPWVQGRVAVAARRRPSRTHGLLHFTLHLLDPQTHCAGPHRRGTSPPAAARGLATAAGHPGSSPRRPMARGAPPLTPDHATATSQALGRPEHSAPRWLPWPWRGRGGARLIVTASG
jgi:hypothetical protein